MVNYSQFIIDSYYKLKGGSNSNFRITPSKITNALQMKVKRVTVPNIFYNVVTGQNDVLYIGDRFKTTDGLARVKRLVLPQGTYPTPESLCLALNVCPIYVLDYPGTDAAMFQLTGTADSRTVNSPKFKYDPYVKRIYIETNYVVTAPGLTFYGSEISDLIGLPSTNVTATISTESSPGSGLYQLYFSQQPDLQYMKYIIVRSHALAGTCAANYKLPNNTLDSVLCTIPLAVPIGDIINYETSVMKDYTDKRNNTWDIELLSDRGLPIVVPPQLRLLIELHFYSDGTAVFM